MCEIKWTVNEFFSQEEFFFYIFTFFIFIFFNAASHLEIFFEFFNVFKFYTWEKHVFFPLNVKDGKTICPDLKKKIPRREKNVWKLVEKKFQKKKQKDIFMCQTVTFKESGVKHENIYFILF